MFKIVSFKIRQNNHTSNEVTLNIQKNQLIRIIFKCLIN